MSLAKKIGFFSLFLPFIPVLCGLILTVYLSFLGSFSFPPSTHIALSLKHFLYDHSYWNVAIQNTALDEDDLLYTTIKLSHYPSFKGYHPVFQIENLDHQNLAVLDGAVYWTGHLIGDYRAQTCQLQLSFHPLSRAIKAQIQGNFALGVLHLEDAFIHFAVPPFWKNEALGAVSLSVGRIYDHEKNIFIENLNGDFVPLYHHRTSLLIDLQASHFSCKGKQFQEWSMESTIFQAQKRRASVFVHLLKEMPLLKNSFNTVFASQSQFISFIDLLDPEWITTEIQSNQGSIAMRISAGGENIYLDGYGMSAHLQELIRTFLPLGVSQSILENQVWPDTDQETLFSSVNLEAPLFSPATAKNVSINLSDSFVLNPRS